MTNEENCALSASCSKAGDKDVCTELCPAYVSVNARYKASRLPKEYKNTFIENSPVKDSQTKLYAILDDYIKSFDSETTRIKSLYLWSKNPGTGKTTTASALLNEYIRTRFMYYARQGKRPPTTLALFVDVNDIHRRYNLAAMTSDKDDLSQIKRELDHASNVEFVVLDDIGVRTDVSDSFRSLVHALVNSRLTKQLPTIYTSNIPVESLHKVFDDRLADRIADMTASIPFSGESKRGVR